MVSVAALNDQLAPQEEARMSVTTCRGLFCGHSQNVALLLFVESALCHCHEACCVAGLCGAPGDAFALPHHLVVGVETLVSVLNYEGVLHRDRSGRQQLSRLAGLIHCLGLLRYENANLVVLARRLLCLPPLGSPSSKVSVQLLK